MRLTLQLVSHMRRELRGAMDLGDEGFGVKFSTIRAAECTMDTHTPWVLHEPMMEHTMGSCGCGLWVTHAPGHRV